jgi:hypothetical protein
MVDEVQRGKPCVRVKRAADNHCLCPIEALKHPKDAFEEEREHRVNYATVMRYSGGMDIVH